MYIRFHRSKTKIRIQQTYYSKDRILLTFSLTEQHLSKGIRTRTSSKRRFSKYVILDYDIALEIQFVDEEVLSSFVSSGVS